jgi:D-threo-aldose 1-dehydrogenase
MQLPLRQGASGVAPMPENVTLPGSGLTVLPVGFGCSVLMGAGNQRLRLLDTAFDTGVRHFDVARSYGYGDAESVLGTFASGRRQQISIATKFGIRPPGRSAAKSLLTATARQVIRVFPALRKAVLRASSSQIASGVFDANEARLSLATSLRELKTDYLDLYLLHDPRLQHCVSPELLRFLEDRLRAGEVRAFGVGTGIDSVLSISESAPAFASVVQFENSVLRRNRERLADRKDQFVITHRSMWESYEQIRALLEGNIDLALNWSRQLDVDCADPAILGELMLSYAVQANRKGAVLFSSRNPDTVRRNVEAVRSNRYSPALIDRFADLVRQHF